MKEPDTATRIASAAQAILVEEGAGAVSMRRVAEAVGVTPMAIYRHFPNRDALLRTVADASFRELVAGWGERALPDDLDARVAGLLENFLDFALGRPHLYTFLITDRWGQAKRFPEDFADGQGPAFSLIVNILAEGMRDGLIRPDDPLEVALTITASVQGLVQQYLNGRIGLPEQQFRALCQRSIWRIFNGIRV